MIKKVIYISLAMGCAFYAAAAKPQPQARNTIREITPYVSPENVAASPAQFSYMADGQHYAMLSADHKRVEVFSIRSGEKTSTLFDADHVRETQIPSIEGFVISPDASKVLVWREKEMIYRRSSKAKYYVYEVRSRLLYPLSTDFDKQSIPQFSPDSRMVAFVAENNIYIKKIDFNSVVAVTTDGSMGKVINGATDWTYEEEFQLLSTLSWSPDNTTLCYVRFDESQVPMYSLPLYEGSCPRMSQYALYPGDFSYKYPVAGQPNSSFTIHSYDVDTRKIKEINLGAPDIEYVPRVDFAPTGNQLMVTTLNRDQNHMTIFSVNPKTTVVKSVFSEKSSAWIIPEAYESLSFEADAFTVMSNRSGYTHLYRYAYNGTLLDQVTSGDFDVTDYYGRDVVGNTYYQAALPTPLDRTLVRKDAKKGTVTTVGNASGTTSATFAPTMSYFTMRFSDTKTPPRYSINTPDGKQVRMLEDNAAFAAKTAALTVNKEFIKIPSDAYQLNAFVLKPDNFDPSRKYPVIMTQYSGPGSQSVLNRWELDWMNYFVKKGYIVACVDGRGTGGRGAEFMQSVYCQLGVLETVDQLNAAAWLAQQSWVDASRIGMFGWSYGGYETLMCATDASNPFAAAVAVAPVTDWRFYDTVYTERYMLTPQQNDKGYRISAPLSRASGLTGNVLIMYGTLDDNVHPANSLQFVAQVQASMGACDMLVFPNKNHSIYGCGARAVVYGKMFDYFDKNLR